MANNGIVKFLTSAKAIISILVVLITLVVWFVMMGSNVNYHEKQLKINTPNIQQNREDIIGIKRDVIYIKKSVDRIEKKL